MAEPMRLVVVFETTFDPDVETPAEVTARDFIGHYDIKRPAQTHLAIAETADAIAEVIRSARVGDVDAEVMRLREETTDGDA